MGGDFRERLAILREQTHCREGRLVGSVTVDQVYAHYQHERLDLRHPRGGHAYYLTEPLLAHAFDYVQSVAGSYLDDGGERGMRHSMEHLSDEVELQAPWEFVDLARSGHPEVSGGGVLVYDRPPKVHRLNAAELRQKNRWRFATLPDRLKGWIYWHNTARGRLGLPPPRRLP